MLLRKNLLYPNKGAAERIAGVILREVQIHERSGLPVRSFRKRPKLVGKPSRPTNFKWSTTEAVAFKRPPLSLTVVEKKTASLLLSAVKGGAVEVSEIADNCSLLR